MTTTKKYPGGTAKIHSYKGVEITEWWFGRWPFEYSIYPIFKAVGRENEVGGGGGWTNQTLAEAHAEIDRFLARAGLDAVPEPESWKPPAGSGKISLTAEQLASKIRTMADAQSIAAAISNPVLQVIHGLPLMSWRVESIAGCIRFGRFDDEGLPIAQIAAINAPESKRSEYDCTPSVPTTILMLGGK